MFIFDLVAGFLPNQLLLESQDPALGNLWEVSSGQIARKGTWDMVVFKGSIVELFFNTLFLSLLKVRIGRL